MKGIVLAAGRGSRLWPITLGTSKQLIPIYDKPLIHYPIATMMLAQIRELLIVVNSPERSAFERALGDGSRFGLSITYATQKEPRGLVDAFLLGEKFIDSKPVSLILGDNIFYGQGLGVQLSSLRTTNGAQIFAYKVADPERYGVVEFDTNGKVISIEEKPRNPKSKFAVPGLYFYDSSVVDLARQVKPSNRGELEITSLNKMYLELGKLTTTVLRRGTAWLDTGTFDSLHAASSFIKAIEDRQGFKVSCLEEIAWRNKWISDTDLIELAKSYGDAPYGRYLAELFD
jgi:glucose-1-phosphate thymidylyltransferase